MEALSLRPSFFSPLPGAASAARAKPRRLSAAKTPPPPTRQPQGPQPNVPHPAHFLRSVGGFLLSCLRGGLGGGGADHEALGAGLLRGGGIGMALMSSEAARRVSPGLRTLAANPTFVSALVAWVVAQSIKVLLNFFVERRWDPAMMFNSGGMPSSHSALCMALTSSVALCHGVGDALFPVCLGFSLIVMYDAIGVRRHAGMQAEVLNKIIEDLFQGHPISQRKLKELLGHTPSQVFAGAVLGILIACICCQGCFVAI